jgi:hypothetical protein
MLDRAPKIRALWDKGNGCLLEDGFANALGVMSSGEVSLARFFAAVWLGDNRRYGFDFVSAAGIFDRASRALVADWLDGPFWP